MKITKALGCIMIAGALLAGCGHTEHIADETIIDTQGNTVQESVEEVTEAPHVHAYAEEILAEATCETLGTKKYSCQCGDSYTEEISAVGHTFLEYVFNEDATYLADGTESATCVNCELVDTRVAEGSKLEYTYAELEKTMYAKSSVNVRNLPAKDGEKLGGLETAQEVKVTGQCKETAWYRIEFDGGIGYVSANYLLDEKPVAQAGQLADPNAATYDLGDGVKRYYGVLYVNVCGNNLKGIPALTPSQGPCPYPLHTLLDNGDGTYTTYVVNDHGGWLDGNGLHFPTASYYHELTMQGYTYEQVGGTSWTSCVGGYDEGCIHKWIVY